MKVGPNTQCTLVKQTSRQGNDHCFRYICRENSFCLKNKALMEILSVSRSAASSVELCRSRAAGRFQTVSVQLVRDNLQNPS